MTLDQGRSRAPAAASGQKKETPQLKFPVAKQA